MTKGRQAQLRGATPEEVLPWMERTGNGYRKAARHFAAELLGGADNVTAADVKYLSGRFNRWWETKKKRGTNHVSIASMPGRTFAAGLAGAMPHRPAFTAPPPAPPAEQIPGSLADLAAEGSEEDWLVASLRQLENAIAKRMLKGSDITPLKKLAGDLRRRLEEIRKPPAPSLDELPAEERRAILEREIPSWPDYVVHACALEWTRRET